MPTGRKTSARKTIPAMTDQVTSSPRSARKNSFSLPKFTSFKKLPMPKSYTPVLIVLLIIASFLLGMLVTKVQYLEQNGSAGSGQAAVQPAAQGAPQPGAKVDVAVGNLPVMGNKNAKVKVVEFADFQCPFCKQWFNDVESSLIKDYVNTGKVAFYWRDYPFLGKNPIYQPMLPDVPTSKENSGNF